MRNGDRTCRHAGNFEKVLLRHVAADLFADGKVSDKKDDRAADESAVKCHAAPFKDACFDPVIDGLEQDRAADSGDNGHDGSDIDEVLQPCRDLEQIGIDARNHKCEHNADDDTPVIQFKA